MVATNQRLGSAAIEARVVEEFVQVFIIVATEHFMFSKHILN